jgi:N-acetylglucosaminyldiphosphoundecaprenol N-acetyl-beta-D-mannosaminyltransferase
MAETAHVIGIPVTADSLTSVVQEALQIARGEQGGYVCVANVHMVTTAKRDEKLRWIMEGADLVTADGLPLVWVLRKLGFKDTERVTGTDLTIQLCEVAETDRMPVYFFGGSSQTIHGLKKFMRERLPSLEAFYEAPPWLPQQPEVDLNVVSRIKASGSSIVFVGLGCPKQEYWMAAHKSHLPALLIGVGAAFDFLAGTRQRAPVRVRNFGLEWLHRLVSEPRRMWKRYVTTNPVFVWILAKEYLKLKNKQFRNLRQ